MEQSPLSTTKGDIFNTLGEQASKVLSLFLRLLSLFWHGRKVLHASQHSVLWQLHLMSAKWSEKHPLPQVASWWQGRGDAVIRTLESCTHLGRWILARLAHTRWLSAWPRNQIRTSEPTSHETLPQTEGWRLGWAPRAVLQKVHSKSSSSKNST